MRTRMLFLHIGEKTHVCIRLMHIYLSRMHLCISFLHARTVTLEAPPKPKARQTRGLMRQMRDAIMDEPAGDIARLPPIFASRRNERDVHTFGRHHERGFISNSRQKRRPHEDRTRDGHTFKTITGQAICMRGHARDVDIPIAITGASDSYLIPGRPYMTFDHT